MNETNLLEKLDEAVTYLSNRLDVEVTWAVITGTGLSDVSHEFETLVSIPYSEIPNMPAPTVEGHRGELILSKYRDTHVLIFCGRLHYYEGRSMFDVTFPVRVARGLGVTNLIITNAAGGLKGRYHTGSLVAVSDHIMLLPQNPLRGLTRPEWGDRFPDPKSVYDVELISRARTYMLNQGEVLETGTYACLQGPSLETVAELKFLKIIGADLVGMSTVPEALVASQCRMRVLALSAVTNMVDPDQAMEEVALDDVLSVSKSTVKPLGNLIKGILAADSTDRPAL